ncbi:unnamed protein product [Notodromas monacha]|uniref:E2F/DP family winged-helix DNA-binding domain-containing protein n=1 Tax=Notodromas monacha TaxID=399045 RepID=A0A7R9BNI2_9CRUS|nr:unnamed protein product [Notodromas monacha]CAG0918780.1 unnamed protein product [Notodromas monacha]
MTSESAKTFSSPIKKHDDKPSFASPLSNLRLLTDVACAEFCETEILSQNSIASDVSSIAGDSPRPGGDDANVHDDLDSKLEQNGNSNPKRGEKLSDICSRFLDMLPLEDIPKEKRPLLDMGKVETYLGVERRRLYDILNIIESLSIVEKYQKNFMRWNGTSKLAHTLHRLKSLAQIQFTLDELSYILDDLVYRKVYAGVDNKPDCGLHELYCACMKKGGCEDPTCKNYDELKLKHDIQEQIERIVDNGYGKLKAANSVPLASDSLKADRPLGIICQRFLILMLLQKPPRALSMQSALKLMKLDCMQQLEAAGKFTPSDQSLDIASKIAEMESKKLGLLRTRSRRLYDVCNVLGSLGIIKRARLIRFEMDCVAGFVYCGPDPESAVNITPSPLVGTRQSLLADQPSLQEHAKLKRKENSDGAARERKRGKFVRHLSLGDMPKQPISIAVDGTSSPKPRAKSILKDLLNCSPSHPPATVRIGSAIESMTTAAVSAANGFTLRRHKSESVVALPQRFKVVYVSKGIQVMTAAQLQEVLCKKNGL